MTNEGELKWNTEIQEFLLKRQDVINNSKDGYTELWNEGVVAGVEFARDKRTRILLEEAVATDKQKNIHHPHKL